MLIRRDEQIPPARTRGTLRHPLFAVVIGEGTSMHEDLIDDLFALTPDVRYVAFGRDQEVNSREREELAARSSSESDRYEELLVNPALLTLARQRGEIDCGGLRFLLVGYGNFHQVVIPLIEGHLSIGFEPDSNPLEHLPRVFELITEEQ
jgi:hypothetical protein